MSYDQPAFAYLESYDDIEAIRAKFAPLASVNKDHKFDNLDKSLFFVIRTQGEDNVHRAMKYGMWTSSSRKNLKLSESFKHVQKQGGDVFLFYTEINTAAFSGVARMTSDFDEKAHFKFWLVENKWFGSFKIEWLYVKDVDFSGYEGLRQIQTLEGSREVHKPVHELIDCTELTKENAKKMLEIYASAPSEKMLFTDFTQLDEIEKKCRDQRVDNKKFERKFEELIKVFEQIPFSFSVASYERRKLHRKQNQMYIQQFYYNPYTVQQYYNQQYYPNPYPNQYNQYQGYPAQQQQFQGQYQQQQHAPQQPQYWQQNNGFYHQQQQSQQNYEKYEDQSDSQTQQNVQDRFQTTVKGQNKKPKNDKRGGKKDQTKYVPKKDYYEQDPNAVIIKQQNSDDETVQQSEQNA